MFPPKMILFPVDFSERCDALAPVAARFAARFHAEITLLNVLSIYNPPEVDEDAGHKLTAFRDREEFRELDVRKVSLRGDPAEEIIRFAHEHKYDLIVMPTHGFGPFRRFLFGSVTLKVLHDAWCPVWTDSHAEELLDHAPEPTPGGVVMCAVDLGDQSHPALHWASEFAKNSGAKLRVVYALPAVTLGGPDWPLADWQEEARIDALHQLAELQSSEHTSGEVEVLSGEVARAIGCAAKRSHADLLVIGRSTSRDGLIGRLRTHAYPIIRQSPCPVVSV